MNSLFTLFVKFGQSHIVYMVTILTIIIEISKLLTTVLHSGYRGSKRVVEERSLRKLEGF